MKRPLCGIKMMMNYSFLMMFETTAFQERYGFDLKDWNGKIKQKCLEHLGDTREWKP